MQTLKHIKEYWLLYAFIAQLVITVALNGADHENFEKRITKLEKSQNEEQIILTDIQTRLSSIETNLEWIKRNLR